jgi:hypothetical protein
MPFTREVLVSELFAHPQRDDITDAILRIILNPPPSTDDALALIS